MLNVKELSLDLGKRTSNQHVIIAQGDTNGTTIEATIYDHGTKLADTGLTAYFVMLLPDGEHYVRDAAEYDTGFITYTVNEAYAAAVTGYTPVAYFELHDGRDTLVATTERFSVTIEQCAYDGLEPAESWDSEIAQLVIDGAEAVNAVEDALEDASTATSAANTAAQSATQATEYATSAANNATSAASAAAQAVESVTTAISNAELATQHAETAASEATQAATTATDATQAATDATTAAQAATQAATDAAALATRAAASAANSGNVPYGTLTGEVVSADDAWSAPPKGVEVFGKSTQVQTTGKNLIPTTIPSNAIHATMSASSGEYVEATLVAAGNAWVFAIPCERNTTYYFSSNANGTIGGLGLSDRLPVLNDTCTKIALMSGMSAHSILTGENDYILIQVSSTAAFNNIPLNHGMLEKGTTATTYEPYSGGAASPRPDWPQEIKSVDDLTLHVCGKNLFDATTWIDDGRIPSVNTGELVSSTVSHRSALVQLNVGTYTYSLVNGYANGPKYVHAYDSNGTWLRTLVAANAGAVGTTYSATFNVTSEVAYVCIVAQIADTNVQLELGTTATTYEPYVGTFVSIPLSDHIARSLPDGTRDELTLSYVGPSTEHEGWAWYSGEVTRRVTTEVIDGSEMDWWKSTSYAGGYYRRAWASNRGIARTSNHLQDRFVTATSTSTYTVGTCLVDESLNFRVDNDLYPTLADFKAWLVGNPVTIQYPLATPTTETLDPIELPILPNPLTAWADGGSAQPTLAMEYERDVNIALVMERDKAMAEIAPLETSPTKANHSVGTYLMYDGTLYKVTRAIASGEQITPGTNVTATTVAAELLALT